VSESSQLLSGRVALVTGAGNGLGRAIAVALAGARAEVILVGRQVANLAETALLIESVGGTSSIEAADVAQSDQVEALRARLTRAPSILINNAGIAGPVASLVDVEPADWDEVFASNVRSAFLMCKAFLPAMIEQGDGDVITIASVSGKRPLAHRTPYVASKMALIGLTRTLAFEVGSRGVRVNTLSPGPVRGPRMERNFALEAKATGISVEEAERAFVSRGALGRLVEESEVAAAVLAMLAMPGLSGADIDLSAGMIAP
jgi:NAD(P)-dependent dehydrogenase (short-subunit alcohol dehydrogenase family)